MCKHRGENITSLYIKAWITAFLEGLLSVKACVAAFLTGVMPLKVSNAAFLTGTTVKAWTAALLVGTLLLGSCSEDKKTARPMQTVEFGFEKTEKSSTGDTNQSSLIADNGNKGAEPLDIFGDKGENNPSPSKLIITVENEKGEEVYSFHEVSLYEDEGKMSAPLSFFEGDFELTQFLVKDDDNNIIYASPTVDADREKLHLVGSPLPLDFKVEAGQPLKLTPEVLPVLGVPADFGYPSFSFTPVGEPFSFKTEVLGEGPGQHGIIPYESEITVTGNYQMDDEKVVLEKELPDEPVDISFEKGYEPYHIEIEATDGKGAGRLDNYENTFNHIEDLEEYDKEENKLTIVLED